MQEEEKFTILGTGTEFKGKMQFSSPVVILGRYEGNITSEGELSIEEHAQVKADVQVKSLVITGGSLTGNIKATGLVDLLNGSSVIGDITASQLHIEKGVTFRGRVSMLKEADSIDIFSASPEQLKKIVRE